jgi:hypothetical protein
LNLKATRAKGAMETRVEVSHHIQVHWACRVRGIAGANSADLMTSRSLVAGLFHFCC